MERYESHITNEKRVHKATRVAAAICSTNFLPTKSDIIGVILLLEMNNLNHEYGVVAEKRNSVMLNKKVKVVAASSPLCSPNHYEVKSAPSNVENMKITHAEIFTSAKHCVGASASSSAAIIPSPKSTRRFCHVQLEVMRRSKWCNHLVLLIVNLTLMILLIIYQLVYL
jgi:hypothetical protein